MLSPAVVQKTLRSVSPDGSVYSFAGTPSQLRGLHPGSILLIGGKALRTVRSVSTAGGQTRVLTGSATLLQAVKNGDIGWNLDIPAGLSTIKAGTEVSAGGGLRRVSPASARLRPACPGCPSGPGTIDYQGSIGGFDVTLHFDESSLAGLAFDVSAKKEDGTMLLKGSGHLRTMDDIADILVQNSKLAHFQYRQGDLTGDATLEWHALTTPGVKSIESTAILRIPVSYKIPFLVGPMPAELILKATLAVYPAIEDHGSSGGKITVEYNSAEDITGGGEGVSASGSIGKAQFRLSGPTVTAGFQPTGLGMDVEFPRVEMSFLGTVTTFVSVLTHVSGYFTPGTTLSNQIPPCQKADGDLLLYAGATLSLFGLKDVEIGSKKLYQSPTWEVHKPGTCGS